MKISSRDFWETFPLLTVKDGVIVSKRGDLTVGWKMTLPPAFSVSSESYTSMLQRMQGAIASLPPWMVVIAFQEQFRLPVNGTVGAITWNAITDVYSDLFNGARLGEGQYPGFEIGG